MSPAGPPGRVRVPWNRDEVILALDLYLEGGRRVLDEHDPRVVELSEVLQRLPFHPIRDERFRSPNSVVLKLANLRSIDRPGSGMPGASATDRLTWTELAGRPEELARLATAIRTASTTSAALPPWAEDDEEAAFEGRLLFRLHRVRERDSGKAAEKRRRALAENGRLACEVCGFDFADTYGDLGDGFVECHHVLPLSVTGETTTRLADLVLVCSNCHRMLHRGAASPGVPGLRRLVEGRRAGRTP